MFVDDEGNDLFEEKSCVAVTQGVVLDASIAGLAPFRLTGNASGVDEESDRDRHFPARDEVIENEGSAKTA